MIILPKSPFYCTLQPLNLASLAITPDTILTYVHPSCFWDYVYYLTECNQLLLLSSSCSLQRRLATAVAEEEELVNFLFGCSCIGYPRTRKEVLALVQDRLRRKGYTHTITNGWWQRFRERNAERLSLRTAAPLSKPRAQATDRDTSDRYYELLENTMKENGLLSKPLQIFNCDESGMPLASKLPKVIAKKEEKNPRYVTADTKAQITVMMCVNAAGGWIPPMVIFDRKKLPKAYTVGEVPNTYYGLSPKGWMDSHLFHDWFSNHFLEYCGLQRPVLLLMDGASSHYSPDMIRTAAKEQVILFVLPPHTTHLSQP